MNRTLVIIFAVLMLVLGLMLALFQAWALTESLIVLGESPAISSLLIRFTDLGVGLILIVGAGLLLTMTWDRKERVVANPFA